jgi:hypothetical protein
MEYRAEQIGGVLQVGSSEEGGTIVTMTLPRSKCNDEREPRSQVARGQSLDCG